MTKVVTMRGHTIDVGQIMAQNERSIAIGNANMNARGDVLGSGGQIIKRKEQVAQEYHMNNPRAVQKISLKDLEPDVFLTPSQAVTKVLAENTAKLAASTAQKSAETVNKKTIVDNDK